MENLLQKIFMLTRIINYFQGPKYFMLLNVYPNTTYYKLFIQGDTGRRIIIKQNVNIV